MLGAQAPHYRASRLRSSNPPSSTIGLLAPLTLTSTFIDTKVGLTLSGEKKKTSGVLEPR